MLSMASLRFFELWLTNIMGEMLFIAIDYVSRHFEIEHILPSIIKLILKR